MAEHENTAGDPLEEAFNAPAAEGHPEAEEAPAATDQAAAGETPEPSEEAPSEDAKLAAERLDSLLRLQAEFTNFKNRAAREKEQLREFVASDIVSLLLPEAVMQQPTSEVEPDHISMVLRYGYRVKERVVRTAQVAVAAAE